MGGDGGGGIINYKEQLVRRPLQILIFTTFEDKMGNPIIHKNIYHINMSNLSGHNPKFRGKSQNGVYFWISELCTSGCVH